LETKELRYFRVNGPFIDCALGFTYFKD
jgi:Ran GTPase-activating protein (RanGAP) involved in mRNA processing and transport